MLTPDLNECAGGTDSCHSHATCHNTEGSYTCSCNTGFTGDGSSCTRKCFLFPPHECLSPTMQLRCHSTKKYVTLACAVQRQESMYIHRAGGRYGWCSHGHAGFWREKMALIGFQSTNACSPPAFVVTPDAKVSRNFLRIFLRLQASKVATKGLGLLLSYHSDARQAHTMWVGQTCTKFSVACLWMKAKVASQPPNPHHISDFSIQRLLKLLLWDSFVSIASSVL